MDPVVFRYILHGFPSLASTQGLILTWLISHCLVSLAASEKIQFLVRIFERRAIFQQNDDLLVASRQPRTILILAG